MFYEEIEYATVISFQFIKSGLENKKICSYFSGEDVEIVKREMTYNGIEVNKFINNGLLHIYQDPRLNYHQRDSNIYENGLENKLPIFTRSEQGERIVFRWIHKIDTEEQIKSNLKWEREYRLNELRTATFLCAYPVDNIISILSDLTGAHAKWMSDLMMIYDGIIFARRFYKGVGFNSY